MQLSVPWRYGQAKPFGSIPRINWAHPLARGLISYCYDCGGGFVVDLVSGTRGVASTTGTGVRPTLSTSKLGQGWKYVSQPASQGGGFVWPATSLTDNFSGTNVNSAVTGYFRTTSGGAGAIYALDNNAGGESVWIGVDGGTGQAQFITNNGSFVTISGTASLNVFSTQAITEAGTAANAGVMYLFTGTSAPVTQTFTVTATTVNNTQIFFCNGSHQGGFMGFIFYGAAWKNRTLTQSELLSLHNDPWQFLIYPEDEIFAMLVGAAVVAALPDAPAERIPWILPGLGPASRHVNLLNAALPVQPVVQPVAGGTLPFMGVGG